MAPPKKKRRETWPWEMTLHCCQCGRKWQRRWSDIHRDTLRCEEPGCSSARVILNPGCPAAELIADTCNPLAQHVRRELLADDIRRLAALVWELRGAADRALEPLVEAAYTSNVRLGAGTSEYSHRRGAAETIERLALYITSNRRSDGNSAWDNLNSIGSKLKEAQEIAQGLVAATLAPIR